LFSVAARFAAWFGAQAPEEERMSFRVSEIMVNALLARAFRRGAPGFGLCGEATRTDEEDDQVDCPDPSRPTGSPPSSFRSETDLAVLRQQLRQAMSVERTA
jgi:hypothetical protein